MQEAQLYQPNENKTVNCTACSWYCTIREGATGVCRVRKNINGKLFSLVYGKPCSVHIDPIEKKPFFHFFPGSRVFSVGTLGCNFSCSFCQNWEISQALRKNNPYFEHQLEKTPVLFSPERIIAACLEQKISVIAFTYNEPAIFFEYAFDTMQRARKHGIKTVFVSNGFESIEVIEKLSPVLSAINIDLKSFSPSFYQKICKAKINPVLNSIKAFAQSPVWLEITTLIIPQKNDSEQELRDIAEFIAGCGKDIPWHISAFHPDYEMAEIPATPKNILEKAFTLGKEAGLKYVYVGNSAGTIHSTTYCPSCKKPVVKRTGYEITGNYLSHGACSFCTAALPGVWE